jgi:hypothetical protein
MDETSYTVLQRPEKNCKHETGGGALHSASQVQNITVIYTVTVSGFHIPPLTPPFIVFHRRDGSWTILKFSVNKNTVSSQL